MRRKEKGKAVYLPYTASQPYIIFELLDKVLRYIPENKKIRGKDIYSLIGGYPQRIQEAIRFGEFLGLIKSEGKTNRKTIELTELGTKYFQADKEQKNRILREHIPPYYSFLLNYIVHTGRVFNEELGAKFVDYLKKDSIKTNSGNVLAWAINLFVEYAFTIGMLPPKSALQELPPQFENSVINVLPQLPIENRDVKVNRLRQHILEYRAKVSPSQRALSDIEEDIKRDLVAVDEATKELIDELFHRKNEPIAAETICDFLIRRLERPRLDSL